MVRAGEVKSAIIIGASSGIGRALAVELAREGYRIGAVARRTELLESLRAELGASCVIRTIDTSKPEAMALVKALIDDMGGVDLFVVSAGTGSVNRPLDWEPECETLALNVVGFAAMVNVAAKHFEARRSGHLVGISSLAGIRGIGGAPAYSASKAFVSNYLQGVRYRFQKMKLPVVVTDVQPGFVDTRMANADRKFWTATVETAARQIARAIRRRKSHVYVTRRWRVIAWLMRAAPEALYSRIQA